MKVVYYRILYIIDQSCITECAIVDTLRLFILNCQLFFDIFKFYNLYLLKNKPVFLKFNEAQGNNENKYWEENERKKEISRYNQSIQLHISKFNDII